MAISSISPTSIADNNIPAKNSSRKDLFESIQENMDKSIDYQIIDKMLSIKTKEEAETQTSVSQKDSLSLSSDAMAISITQQNTQSNSQQQSINQVTIEASSSRLLFSSVVVETPIQTTDPLAFDLDGNGIETTGIKQAINFDINGDGITEKTSFIGGNDAFLAYDKNGNGLIDNGKELFGDQHGAANGFEELSKYDDNKDGVIDKNDAIYADLKLVSLGDNQQLKTSSLAEHSIQSINLDYANQHQAINYYDSIEQTGQFTRSDGSVGYTADIMLAHR